MEIRNAERFICVINGKDGKIIRTDKNGVEYLFCDMNEDTDIIGGQTGRQTKIVRADRLPIIFNKIVEAIAKVAKSSTDITYDEASDNYLGDKVEITTKVSGAFYNVPVEPYYLRNADGTRMTISQGKRKGEPVVMTSYKFFAFAGEEPLSLLERETANLDWVVAQDDSGEVDEEVVATEQVANNAAPKGNRRG